VDPVVAVAVAAATATAQTPPSTGSYATFVPTEIRRESSAELKKVVEMLRAPQSLRTAFLLQEILGPPKSKRRGR
jgi:hypothetical protein